MFGKRRLFRALLALGLIAGAYAAGASPAQAGESCWQVNDSDLGSYRVCHPMP